MYNLNYFYRCPNPIYFSIERLFKGISRQVTVGYSQEIEVRESFLPFPSKLKTIFSNILFAKRTQANINHITGDVHYIILGCSRKNVNILTIHDCVALHRHPVWHPWFWILKWLWYDLPVKKADVVTVISEATRKELLRFIKCDPRKISVIANFVDPVFQPDPRDFKRERPRVLFIGSTPNKNLDRLIEAMEGINAELDIIGNINDEQLGKLDKYQISFCQSSGLTPQALLDKYIHCDLLAFPSTYEGFGLPIIEAQATGRPVLTSDLLPMKDVSGVGACLVDPYDVASIRRGLVRILEDEEYRQKIIADGFMNVKRFQLEEITGQYVSLYRKILQQKSINS